MEPKTSLKKPPPLKKPPVKTKQAVKPKPARSLAIGKPVLVAIRTNLYSVVHESAGISVRVRSDGTGHVHMDGDSSLDGFGLDLGGVSVALEWRESRRRGEARLTAEETSSLVR